jgi:hypothetical protein
MKVLFIFNTAEGRSEEEYELDAVPCRGDLVRTSKIAAIRVSDVAWTPERQYKAEVVCTHPNI